MAYQNAKRAGEEREKRRLKNLEAEAGLYRSSGCGGAGLSFRGSYTPATAYPHSPY